MSSVYVTLLHPHNIFIINSQYYFINKSKGLDLTIPLEPIQTDIYLEILHGSRRIFFKKNLLNKKDWKFFQSYQEMEIFHIVDIFSNIEITFEIYVLKGYILLRKIYFDWIYDLPYHLLLQNKTIN